MTKRPPRSQPRWTDVKAKLTGLDRMGLIGLVQDLYTLRKDNQTFLHTRFGLGEDALKPYKETLDRWLWPDVLRNQDISVAKAKQAISSYRKAVGEPGGLAELMVSFCENAAGFSDNVGYQDESYFDALINMFEQALKVTCQLPAGDRDALIARLYRVRTISHNFGYGVGAEMDDLLAKYDRTELILVAGSRFQTCYAALPKNTPYIVLWDTQRKGALLDEGNAAEINCIVNLRHLKRWMKGKNWTNG